MLPGTALAQQDQPPREPGVSVRLYDVGQSMAHILPLVAGQTPNISKVMPTIDLVDTRGDFGGLDDAFLTIVEGFIRIDEEGAYTFRLISDDGSRLQIDEQVVIDHDGLHAPEPKDATIHLTAGDHALRVTHFESGGGAMVQLLWQPPGTAGEEFVVVPTDVLSCPAGEVRVTSPGPKKVIRPLRQGRPGDGWPLEGVHPSFDLVDLRPEGFTPRVGGIDWLSDGRMVICTWDADGAVYLLEGTAGADPHRVRIKRFAAGLAEPLGLTVVEDRIYVLQKQELTELVDHDHDDVADEYRTVCGGWPVTSNFHEFAFGLVYQDGAFYANLAVAIDPGGRTTVPQVPGRGTVIRINLDGTYEFIAGGLRTPNGIGLGPEGELFVTDNQGDWLPCSKLLHVREGAFYGSRLNPPGEFEVMPVTPPVVWLPHGEIGNSPSSPVEITLPPYTGQMLVGDVTHGGIKRVFVEKIGGEYQGCVFRFSQGLDAGVNRIAWGPDGALYAGGIGSTGNWGQEGKKRYALQKLQPNGTSTFEMLAVRAKTDGLELEFTEPLATGEGWDPEAYYVSQWRYEPTQDYGGPKIDEQRVTVTSASVQEDRRRVFLQTEGLQPGHVAYVRIVAPITSALEQKLWSTEVWYTLNQVPKDEPGQVREAPPMPEPNTLTEAEQAAGWRLLFDGKTTEGWRGFKKTEFPKEGWVVQDGALTCLGRGGDIITVDQFDNFELSIEWKVAKNGNSGIFYHVQEDNYDYVWRTAPEYQILDNEGHKDGGDPRTSAGANYALHAPQRDLTRPVGTFNQARIIVQADHVEHWLNGEKLLEYELGSEDWKQKVAASKFKDMPDYGKFRKGHIALQDHGDVVAYRNIKIRPLAGK